MVAVRQRLFEMGNTPSHKHTSLQAQIGAHLADVSRYTEGILISCHTCQRI